MNDLSTASINTLVEKGSSIFWGLIDIIKMTLKEAVKKVIEQNISIGFHPEIFIVHLENGEAPDLSDKVSRLVFNQNAIDSVSNAIRRYGEVLTIEDLIIEDVEGFGLSKEVIDKARENVGGYKWLRENYKSLK